MSNVVGFKDGETLSKDMFKEFFEEMMTEAGGDMGVLICGVDMSVGELSMYTFNIEQDQFTLVGLLDHIKLQLMVGED